MATSRLEASPSIPEERPKSDRASTTRRTAVSSSDRVETTWSDPVRS